MRKHLLNGTVALSLALSACSLAPNYQRPEMALPTGWSNVAGVGATQQNTSLFWQDLGSVELDRLIDQVLAQNLDLEAALQRIDQARAQAKIASSPLYPSVSASGSASRTFQDPKDTNSAHIGGGVSYTLAKSRDDASSIGGGGTVVAQNDQDLAAEWGLSSFDRRQQLSANLNAELPFGPNKRWLADGGFFAKLFENWRAMVNMTLQLGTLFTPRVLSAIGRSARPHRVRSPVRCETARSSRPFVPRWYRPSPLSRPGRRH